MKWLTGIGCGIAVIGSTAVSIFIPALKPLCSAITAAAVQVFMEVIVENKTLSNVNWKKVAVSAAAGALCSFVGPHVGSAVAKGVGSVLGAGTKISMEVGVAIAKYAGDAMMILSNSVIAGATSAAFTAIDGGSWEDMAKSFGMGVGIGVAFGVAFQLVGAGVGKLVSKVTSAINNKFPNNWAQKAANGIKTFINGHKVSLGKMDDIIIAKSTYQAAYQGFSSARINVCNSEIVNNAVMQLPGKNNKNFKLCDSEGNPISKNELTKNGGNGKIVLKDTIDPKLKAALVDVNGNPITEIKITNGMPDMKDLAIGELKLSEPLTPQRYGKNGNFNKFYNGFAEQWNEDPSSMSEKIKNYFDNNSIDYLNGNIKGKDVQNMLSSIKITFHEDPSRKIVYLVDTGVHSKISHYGGVGVAKIQAEYNVGNWYFKQLYGGN